MIFSLSIVIPCRNEEKYIARCLQSIVDNNFDKKYLKVYVCDGLSIDRTHEIIKEFSAKYDYIEYVENTKKTTPFALNLGIKKSMNNDYVMILGAHSELTNSALNDILHTFEIYPDADCVGGFINNIYENDKALYIGKAMSSKFGVGNAHFRLGKESKWVDTVAFGTYKTEVFKKIGFFDDDLVRNQDDEFSFRMLKYGMKIFLNSDIKINYYVRSSFLKLFKQYYQYGLWKVFVNVKHKTITTIRQLIPFFLVVYVLFSIFFSLIFSKYAIYTFPFLILYFLMAKIFAIKVGLSIKEILGIFWSFILLHFGYGLGYLIGIVKFIIFRQKPQKDEISTR